jgi:hypothetical protein
MPWFPSPIYSNPFLEGEPNMRRRRRNVINVQPAKSREELEGLYGQAWTVPEVARDFIITAIIDHTVVVRRKADDVAGTLKYQEGPPCLYFSFTQQPGDQ